MHSRASNLAVFSFCKHEHQLKYYSFPPSQVLNNLWMDSKRWLTTVLCSDGLLFSCHFFINNIISKRVWENQYCIGLAWYKDKTLSAHCTWCLCVETAECWLGARKKPLKTYETHQSRLILVLRNCRASDPDSCDVGSWLRFVWGGGICPRGGLLRGLRLRLWRGTGCCRWFFLHQLRLILASLGRMHQDSVDDTKVLRLHGAHIAIPFHHALWQGRKGIKRNEYPYTTAAETTDHFLLLKV